MNSKIKRIAKVFPDDMAETIRKFVESSPLSYGWASNKRMGYTHWNCDYARAGADNGLDVSHRLPAEMAAAWSYLKQQYLGDVNLLRCYTNAHTYGIEGNPHTDSSREDDYTIVVYMNTEWPREYGGETLVYDGNEIVHAELPHFNHGLVFPGAAWHCARSVTRICPELRRTLMFKFAPKDCDVQRDKIQVFLQAIGADKIKHTGRKLSNHLLNTYDSMRAAGADPVACAAGGLHSIFGTNAFRHRCLEKDQRNVVVSVIGEEATELVELFRDIARPKTLESALASGTTTVVLNDGNTRVLSQEQLNRLCAMEVANLRDQTSLARYPHLSRFKNNRKKKCQ